MTDCPRCGAPEEEHQLRCADCGVSARIAATLRALVAAAPPRTVRAETVNRSVEAHLPPVEPNDLATDDTPISDYAAGYALAIKNGGENAHR